MWGGRYGWVGCEWVYALYGFKLCDMGGLGLSGQGWVGCGGGLVMCVGSILSFFLFFFLSLHFFCPNLYFKQNQIMSDTESEPTSELEYAQHWCTQQEEVPEEVQPSSESDLVRASISFYH